MLKLTKRDYEFALDAQDASNLVAVVNAYAKVLSKLLHLSMQGEDVNVRTHPLSIMYANKILALTHCDDTQRFSSAYDECKGAVESMPDTPEAEYDQMTAELASMVMQQTGSEQAVTGFIASRESMRGMLGSQVKPYEWRCLECETLGYTAALKNGKCPRCGGIKVHVFPKVEV